MVRVEQQLTRRLARTATPRDLDFAGNVKEL
ncbi:uncharacterized protein METZ01_LOCUS118113, partial [marine metagenome]